MGFGYTDKWLSVSRSQAISAKPCMQRRLCRYDLLFLFPSLIIFEAMFVLYGFGETYKRMNSQTHFCVSQTYVFCFCFIFWFLLYQDSMGIFKILWAYSLFIIFWSPRYITRLPRLVQLCQANWFDSYKRFSYAPTIFAAKSCDVSFIKLLFRKKNLNLVLPTTSHLL